MESFRFRRVSGFIREERGREKGVKSVKISGNDWREWREWIAERADLLIHLQVYGVPTSNG